MISIYQLKSRFQALLRPLVKRLAAVGCTANHLTVFACLLSILTGCLVFAFPAEAWVLLSVPAILFVRMALNAMDGMLAREHDLKSPLGALLNELTDVISDAALFLPFAYVAGFRAELVCMVVILGVISEMTGVVGVQIGASRRFDGPMGKSDRAFVFGALSLLTGLRVPIAPFIPFVLYGMLLLLSVTIINRARKALGEVAST